MKKKIIEYDLLFEVKDVFGRKIRTTKDYWQKIRTLKHRELKYDIPEVKNALTKPEEVRRSVTDSTILLYAQKQQKYDILIVAVKVLNGNGFLVTVYQTKEFKKKGELLWPKQK
mgnify:CR=1 FL=1